MRRNLIATWAAVALCAGCTGSGNGSTGMQTAGYSPAAAGALAAASGGYGPAGAQPATWTDRLQAAVTAPFRTASPPPATESYDPLQLTNGSGPATPALFVSMGGISERTGDVQQSRQLYSEALRLEPRHVPALVGMARLEDRQGRLDDALRWYQQAATIDPEDATVANDFGLCLARAGRMEDALAPLGQAVRRDPSKPLYRNNIAKVLVSLDRPAEAAQHLAAVHEPAVVNYNMAILLIDLDRVDEAARCLQLATSIDPQLDAANELLAQMTQPAADEQLLADDQDEAEYTAWRPETSDPLATAVAQAEAEAEPWPALNSQGSAEEVLPTPAPETPSTEMPATPRDHFAEPILLPAVD